jgi:hypothetical protein
VGTIEGAGAFNLQGNTLTTNADADTTVSGIISGSGGSLVTMHQAACKLHEVVPSHPLAACEPTQSGTPLPRSDVGQEHLRVVAMANIELPERQPELIQRNRAAAFVHGEVVKVSTSSL